MAQLLDQDGRVLAEQVEIASSITQRMRGLLGRSTLPAEHALLIERCGSVHTWGMRFDIAIVFLDASWRVLRTIDRLPPWRLASGGLHACRTVEWRADSIKLPAVGSTLHLGLSTSPSAFKTDHRSAPPLGQSVPRAS